MARKKVKSKSEGIEFTLPYGATEGVAQLLGQEMRVRIDGARVYYQPVADPEGPWKKLISGGSIIRGDGLQTHCCFPPKEES